MKRKRPEFVRRAIDSVLDRSTREAYLLRPLPDDLMADDLAGWDPHNQLARVPKAAHRRGSA